MVNFKKRLTNVLNTHTPIKTKMIRFNSNAFMTKELEKETMKRSKLSEKNEKPYHYYENLSLKNVMDNKTFWKTVKRYCSDKGSNSRRITFLENDSILTDGKTDDI